MKKKRLRWLLAGIVALLVLGFFSEPGKALRDIVGAGFLERPDKKEYVADREGNLRSLYTALNLYHDSEGAYPPAGSWMDAIEPRLKSNDLTGDSASKKLIRPGVSNGFGYAISVSAAGRYKDDVKGGRVLIFESEDTARNASGEPKSGTMAVTVDGKIVTVP